MVGGGVVGFLVLVVVGSPAAAGQAGRFVLIFTLRLRLTPTLVSRIPKSPRTLSRVMPTSKSQTSKVTDLISSRLRPCVPT